MTYLDIGVERNEKGDFILSKKKKNQKTSE